MQKAYDLGLLSVPRARLYHNVQISEHERDHCAAPGALRRRSRVIYSVRAELGLVFVRG